MIRSRGALQVSALHGKRNKTRDTPEDVPTERGDASPDIDAFRRRDIEALLEVSDPEIEFRSIFAGIESGGAFRGHDGVRNWWKNLLSAFPDLALEVDDVRDLGDVTVARVRLLGHGRESSVPVKQATWSVANWRDGKAS